MPLEGEAIRTKMVFLGNPLKIKLPMDVGQFIKIVAREGMNKVYLKNLLQEMKDNGINFISLRSIRNKDFER